MEPKTNKYALVDYCYQDFMQDELRNTDFIESIIESINNKSNSLVTIIHHSDMDGICAAQIMMDFCYRVLNVSKVDLIQYNYSNDFDINKHINSSCNYVIAVDLSIPYKEWYKIFNKKEYRKGLFIDHHLGSVRDIYEHETEFNSLPLEKFITIDGCGTALSYFLTKSFYSNIKFVTLGKLFNERTIFLIDTYDRWLDTEDKYWADCLNKYLYASNQLFVDSKPVRDVLYRENNKLSDALTKGNTYLQLEKQLNVFKYNDFSEELTLHTPDGSEYKACVMWGPGNSQLFGDHIKDFDVVIRANYNAEKQEYYFSFYTVKEDIDCCAIAKQYLGSGHKFAAGCMTSYNILNKKWKVDN